MIYFLGEKRPDWSEGSDKRRNDATIQVKSRPRVPPINNILIQHPRDKNQPAYRAVALNRRSIYRGANALGSLRTPPTTDLRMSFDVVEVRSFRESVVSAVSNTSRVRPYYKRNIIPIRV